MKILKRLLVLLAIALSFCIGAIVNSICSIAQLEELAKAEGVAVYYVTAEKMLEEKEKYGFNKTLHGLYFSNEKKIYILRQAYLDYAILAHELGHHYAIDRFDDGSETMANIYGVTILKNLK